MSFRFPGADSDCVLEHIELHRRARRDHGHHRLHRLRARATVLKLIARFYDVTGGSVTVDGVDVRDDAPGRQLRELLGYVPQKGVAVQRHHRQRT